MATQFSLQLIAALLLGSYVAAQYIGLRPVSNLRESFGLALCIAVTFIVASLIDWLLTRHLLQPFGLLFLHILTLVLVIAVAAQVIEAALRRRYPGLFPSYGNWLPQIIIGALILALPLLTANPLFIVQHGFMARVGDTLLFAVGATILLCAFQAIRDHNSNSEVPLPLRGAAIDMLSAAVLVAASSGLNGIF